MASLYWAKKNTAWVMPIKLFPQSGSDWLASPTIASGDFKRVGYDSTGAVTLTINNPTTLPSTTPASSGNVLLSLSSTEMNNDIIMLDWKDAAGAEWQSGGLVIFTTANGVDDLALASATTDIQNRLPAALVSGRIDASVGAMATNVVTAAAIATDAIGAAEIAADAIAEIQSGLGTSSNQTTIIAALTAIAGYIDTEVAAILNKVNALPSDPADASDVAAAVTAAQAAIIAAQPSAAAVVAALMAYALESGKTTQQALLDIWAVDVGGAVANSATNPTTLTYASPDGTPQVIHTQTSVTRAVS